jgi:signal transduction histidine kinase/ligand-binding sensor domain-containing protein
MHKRILVPIKIFLLTVFWMILVISVSAQLNPDNITQYTEKDGLPGGRVNSLLVDKYGFIWTGTINGLARFDGYEFKRFFSNPNDTNSIKGLVCWALFEDRKGQIWAATGQENLNVYNPVTRSFRHYDYKHLIDHPSNIEIGIYCINQDQNGKIFLGVSTNFGEPIPGALLYFDDKEDRVKRIENPGNFNIQNVISSTVDSKNNLWVLSYSGIFKINSTGKIDSVPVLNSLYRKMGDYNNGILADNESHIWVVSNKGTLTDYDPHSKEVKVHLFPQKISRSFNFSTIAFDTAQNIWLGTDQGLAFFDKEKKAFSLFKQVNRKNPALSVINQLQVDSFGSVWVATASEGLLRYEEKIKLRSYSNIKRDKNSLSPGWANNLMQSGDGKIWVTTTNGGAEVGLNELDAQGNLLQSIPVREMIPGLVNIAGLSEMAPNEFILSTNVGIFQFSVKSKIIKRISISGYTDENYLISCFFTDSKQNQWLGSNNGLYRKSANEGSFKKYDLSKQEGADGSSNEVTRIFESPKHGLWLLTNNGLFLFKYDTDKIERHGYDKAKGDVFLTQDINSFYEDSSGTAWVGTWQGGLSKYSVEERKIKTYSWNDGLPSMSIQGILGDERNHTLWLSTFDGLCKFNMETGQTNTYSIADGIQSQLFADGSYLKTKNGFFVFGGANGITLFNPDNINRSSLPPRVMITDLKLFNKTIIPGQSPILKNSISETSEITLAYNQNNISLDFIALHYSDPGKNNVAFKMENYDNDWRVVRNQREAFYPQLPPGKYIFHLKAANNNGVWNEEGVSLSITVLPPWWQAPWAYGVYALALLALGFLVNRYMRQRLLAAEKEKNRARDLAQAKEIEKAYHKLEETHETLKATQSQLIQSEKMASLGELTAGIAHEIQNPLNFINNFSEINTELIDELNDGIEKGNLDEVKTIAADIRENESKINHHGKRADAIVKGMLQHSRVSTGQKESADINALVDEYIRLSYHGLRAKDKSFNATIKSDLDQSLADIQIIPQDIGRVVLNLLNNAFFSVAEKSKQNIQGYEPMVTITTKNLGGKVRISVHDNGMGIPAEIREKIFQPFFTTKSSGQGTGLGLSLSYDIVKAHGGDISIDSKTNEYTVFHIDLPV